VAPLISERKGYLEALGHHLGGRHDAEHRRVALTNLELHRQELAAERDALRKMLQEGRITDGVLVQVQRDLDLREMRQEHALPSFDQQEDQPREKGDKASGSGRKSGPPCPDH